VPCLSRHSTRDEMIKCVRSHGIKNGALYYTSSGECALQDTFQCTITVSKYHEIMRIQDDNFVNCTDDFSLYDFKPILKATSFPTLKHEPHFILLKSFPKKLGSVCPGLYFVYSTFSHSFFVLFTLDVPLMLNS
jgi:hypothetical protein